jgi:uncharacterized protein (DUF427 family)
MEMPKAIWNEAVLAEAPDDAVLVVEDNIYFPPESVHQTYLRPSDTRTVCGWKGTASYYDVVVDGQINPDAAWFYPEPQSAAQHIANHIAFWKGVRVER